jgi:hypothetical protein
MTTYYATATNNLYLIASYGTASLGGAIFSGKPDPTLAPPQLFREYRSSSIDEVFYQFASDSRPYNPEFSVIVVSSDNRSNTSRGKIYKSTRVGNDIGGWTEVYSTNAGDLQGCAYGNNVWIAVGENNLVVRSTNGTSWSVVQGAVPNGMWKWMTFGGGRFVAVGYKTVPDPADPVNTTITQGIVMYSDNDGVTWTQAESGSTNRLQSVAYSPELNKFVAVGKYGTIIAVDGK